MKSQSAKLLVLFLGVATLIFQGPGGPAAVSGAEFRIGAATTNVNLRKAPSLQDDIVAGLQRGQTLQVFGEKDGWYRVAAKKNYTTFNGWVYKRYVAISQPEAAPPLPEPAKPQPLTTAQPAAPSPAPVKASPPPTAPAPPPVPVAKPAPQPAPEPPAAAEKPIVAAEQNVAPVYPAGQPSPSSAAGTPASAPPAKTDGKIRLLLSISPLVLAIIALLVAVRAFRSARDAAGKARPAAAPLPAKPVVEKPKTEKPAAAGRKPAVNEKRRAPRTNRLIEIDFAVDGKFFRGFINNLSETGVYVDTPEKFAVGREITISCPDIETGGYIKRSGLIVRLTPTGIAVHFEQDTLP